MVRHIVTWTIKEANGQSKQENIELLANQLKALKTFIPQIVYLEVGINSSKAPQNNFDIVLISDFASFEDLDIYQEHPEHLKVVELVKSIRVDRACVDYEY